MEVLIVAIVVAVALAVVAIPLFRREDVTEPLTKETLAREVSRYREAIRARTLCRRCLTANAVGSRYCSECGRALKY